ncbi:MAG: HPr family phosphocarrier protein [Eubacterium sp.]
MRKEKQTANARSLMSVLGLCARKNDCVQVMVDGVDEKEAMEAIVKFLENLSE